MARKEQERADAARKNQEEKEINEALLGSALDEWLATLDVRESTRKEYEYCVTVYKNALGEDVCVADITLTDVERAFTSWAPRSGRTKMKHLAMLARFFRWAKKHSYCKLNPAEEYEAPVKWRKQVRLSKETTGKVLEIEDARTLLAACKERFIVTINGKAAIRKDTGEVWEKTPPGHLYLFVLLALRSGLRAGNLLGENGLRWDDVDLERGIVCIDARRVKNELDFAAPLHPEVVVALRNTLRVLNRPPRKKERILKPEGVKTSFHSACKRAGLGEKFGFHKKTGRVLFRPHDLRHTFASWIGAYAPEFVVARLLGHAKGSVTDRYAGRQDVETLRSWLEKMEWLESEAGERTADGMMGM
jgi:integrase